MPGTRQRADCGRSVLTTSTCSRGGRHTFWKTAVRRANICTASDRSTRQPSAPRVFIARTSPLSAHTFAARSAGIPTVARAWTHALLCRLSQSENESNVAAAYLFELLSEFCFSPFCFFCPHVLPHGSGETMKASCLSLCLLALCADAGHDHGARMRLRGGSGQAHEMMQAVLARRAAALASPGGARARDDRPAACYDQRDFPARVRGEAEVTNGMRHGEQNLAALGEQRSGKDGDTQKLRTWEERIDEILGPSSDDERMEKIYRARAALAVPHARLSHHDCPPVRACATQRASWAPASPMKGPIRQGRLGKAAQGLSSSLLSLKRACTPRSSSTWHGLS